MSLLNLIIEIEYSACGLSLSLFNLLDLNQYYRGVSLVVCRRNDTRGSYKRRVNKRRMRDEKELEKVTDSSAVISARSGTLLLPWLSLTLPLTSVEWSGSEIGIGDDTMAGRVHRLCVTYTKWSSYSQSTIAIANGTNAFESPSKIRNWLFLLVCQYTKLRYAFCCQSKMNVKITLCFVS